MMIGELARAPKSLQSSGREGVHENKVGASPCQQFTFAPARPECRDHHAPAPMYPHGKIAPLFKYELNGYPQAIA